MTMEEPKIPLKIVMPQSVKVWVAIQAAKNMRSQTSEIVLAIREKMERTGYGLQAPEAEGRDGGGEKLAG